MINPETGIFENLKVCDKAEFEKMTGIFVEGEEIINAFKSGRDGVLFTNKRVISLNVQGMTGKKQLVESIPYARVLNYSVESAGMLDSKNYLEICLANKTFKFELLGKCELTKLYQTISGFIL